ncbi:MAG TPA: hypothetical protein DCS13_07625 [Candidatus Margulisbacteria bacterium]|nr:MAG: hypothetical protein A2X43_06915 [Candidatus Margulisbacteria bacterium GWD2_39_127]HAR63316.1 hypothetical protein [Candidatus Margulisiibacteriota bacterium]
MKCKQAINPTTTAEGTCVNMFMDLRDYRTYIWKKRKRQLQKKRKITTTTKYCITQDSEQF